MVRTKMLKSSVSLRLKVEIQLYAFRLDRYLHLCRSFFCLCRALFIERALALRALIPAATVIDGAAPIKTDARAHIRRRGPRDVRSRRVI